ncbi:glycosyltransferase family 4 protein [Streptomyces chartreusis]|uniref:glycosyltransferase family 4 protein n=1 Tax=Streptomyces chartreusis TaxID=1969 RepID=UPI0033A1FA38
MRKPCIGVYAHVSSLDDSFGGVEVFTTRLVSQLAKLGHPVVLHALASTLGTAVHGAREPSPGRDGVTVFHPRSGPGFDGCVRENAEVSLRHDEQIIFALGIRDPHVYQVALETGRRLGRPVVSFVYNSLNERLFRAQLANRTNYLLGVASEEERTEFLAATHDSLRRTLRASDLVVVPTDYMRGEAAGVLGDTLAAHTLVNFHGVPTGEFTLVPRPEYRGTLLHLSRMMYPQALSKNFLWSCRLIDRLHQRDGAVERLTLVGAGRDDHVVRDYAGRLGAAGAVDFAGAVPQHDLPRVYAQSDVLLCPSMMESSCQSLLEALLTGCVPVVLDFGGSAEVMRRLGLKDLLVSPVEAQEGPFTTVVPRIEHAVEIITMVRQEWDRVTRLVARAAATAAEELSLERTTDELLGEVRRRGLLGAGGSR